MSKNDLTLLNSDFDLFDPFFNDEFFRGPKFDRPPFEVLKTDVIENNDNYELVMDVPGIEKENISIDIEDGYITIGVTKKETEETKKKHFVRKERFNFHQKRTFYVGNVEIDNIKAKLENGVLTITIPKEQEKIINKKQIAID